MKPIDIDPYKFGSSEIIVLIIAIGISVWLWRVIMKQDKENYKRWCKDNNLVDNWENWDRWTGGSF